LTGYVPHPTVAPHLDKGTPGQSRGRKATGPRLLRDASRYSVDATKGRKIAEPPKGQRGGARPPHTLGGGRRL